MTDPQGTNNFSEAGRGVKFSGGKIQQTVVCKLEKPLDQSLIHEGRANGRSMPSADTVCGNNVGYTAVKAVSYACEPRRGRLLGGIQETPAFSVWTNNGVNSFCLPPLLREFDPPLDCLFDTPIGELMARAHLIDLAPINQRASASSSYPKPSSFDSSLSSSHSESLSPIQGTNPTTISASQIDDNLDVCSPHFANMSQHLSTQNDPSMKRRRLTPTTTSPSPSPAPESSFSSSLDLYHSRRPSVDTNLPSALRLSFLGLNDIDINSIRHIAFRDTQSGQQPSVKFVAQKGLCVDTSSGRFAVKLGDLIKVASSLCPHFLTCPSEEVPVSDDVRNDDESEKENTSGRKLTAAFPTDGLDKRGRKATKIAYNDVVELGNRLSSIFVQKWKSGYINAVDVLHTQISHDGRGPSGIKKLARRPLRRVESDQALSEAGSPDHTSSSATPGWLPNCPEKPEFDLPASALSELVFEICHSATDIGVSENSSHLKDSFCPTKGAPNYSSFFPLRYKDASLPTLPPPVALIAGVQGGPREGGRQEVARQMATLYPNRCVGFSIGGFGYGESLRERRKLLTATLTHLPINAIRFLPLSGGNPLDLLHAVACGIDIIEPSCTTITGTDKGGFKALVFDLNMPESSISSTMPDHRGGNSAAELLEEAECSIRSLRKLVPASHSEQAAKGTVINQAWYEIDLRDRRWAKDFRPLSPLSCRSESRAYIHHLINANEMLASTLIVLNNLHLSSLLLRTARHHISMSTFQSFVEWFITANSTRPGQKAH